LEENESLNKTINRSFRDPVAALLLKSSNLTKIQYESLIIDYITDYVTDIELTYDKKALYRSKRVSRGSFSRTLSQAKKNIISSIYTILLLSYVGVFDTSPFDEYRALSEKLHDYASYVKNAENIDSKQFLTQIEIQLAHGIRTLAEPGKLK
jgi:hypothetical protein